MYFYITPCTESHIFVSTSIFWREFLHQNHQNFSSSSRDNHKQRKNMADCSSLLREMLGSRTYRNFLSHTVYEILIYRHYPTSVIPPFYHKPVLEREQQRLLANKTLLNHDTCYSLIPRRQWLSRFLSILSSKNSG
jgi:hypothetical protein